MMGFAEALHMSWGHLRHLWFRIARPVTLGVQGIVLDEQGRVFLVRHTYVPGWHFPGGGVEAGETAAAALRRELREEGHIEADSPPQLHGIFFNDRFSRRDHIVVMVLRHFHQTSPRSADAEIAETGFFPVDQLPAGTTLAAQARLMEVLTGATPAARWLPPRPARRDQ
ncbi:MAG: NUDIX domain-containing protein [Hyphomicrobiales bacterium]|nr:NUDIX domain-containing protein [Hyphomicrobiales bacterium]